MANYVKITSLGPRALDHVTPPDGQAAVDKMIDHWRTQVAMVLPDKPDLIVVPEACDRYPLHSLEQRWAYFALRGNQVRDFFTQIAKDNHCNVAYSAARGMPDGTWANSTQIIGRDGQVRGIYNKNHPTVDETLVDKILAGTEAPVIETDFGRVACAICFDLNFDVLRLQYVHARPRADLIIFCSMYHGGMMQNYWAYTCRAHFVGSTPTTPCSIISPQGVLLARSTNYRDYVTATVNLDCRVAHLDYNEEKLQAAKAKYGPKITVFDPGRLGSVLISSESDEFTAAELVEEFEIELLDDYFPRAIAVRDDPVNQLNCP